MKALKIILALWLSYILVTQAFASNVENIEVVDSKNINIVFDTGTILPEWDINSDIKVLKDIALSFASKDLEDEFKLILDLNGELKSNAKYSLLSILWPEWNIDFTIGDAIDGLEILNDTIPEGQWVTKIMIKDSKTIELFYNNPVAAEEFEFKLLSESTISSLTALNDNTISVLFEGDLTEYSNYILMLLSVSDRLWSTLTFDEDLLDFSTEVFVVAEAPIEEPIIEDTPVEEENNEPVIEETTDTNEDEWNLEEISLNAAATPDTGAATWVLLMLTFVTNTCIFFRKKLIKA